MRLLEKVNILLQFCVNMIGWIDKKWSLDHRKHVLDQVLLNVIEEAVSCLFLLVVKQRMQMFNSPYRGVVDCVSSLLRHEGPAAFYRSYTTQLTMNVPFQVLHFMTYEYLQELLNPHRQYNPSSHVVSGALAGALAAAATTPLDVCKTLLNTQETRAIHVIQAEAATGAGAVASASSSRQISGLGEAFRTVYRMGGFPAFFKGVQARVIYQMPSTAISWSVYEFFKYILTKRQHERRLHGDRDGDK